jgi:hypothetical protein
MFLIIKAIYDVYGFKDENTSSLFLSQEDSMKNILLSLIKNEVGNQHATKKP